MQSKLLEATLKPCAFSTSQFLLTTLAQLNQPVSCAVGVIGSAKQ
jgi:hypothetical protein